MKANYIIAAVITVLLVAFVIVMLIAPPLDTSSAGWTGIVGTPDTTPTLPGGTGTGGDVDYHGTAIGTTPPEFVIVNESQSEDQFYICAEIDCTLAAEGIVGEVECCERGCATKDPPRVYGYGFSCVNTTFVQCNCVLPL